jgi:uncharacterized protein YggE
MTNRTLAAMAALALAGALGAPANAADMPGRPATLTVTGEGSITQAPDRATVSFRIETIDEQAAAATSQNAAVTSALGTKLAPLGIAGSAIKTTGYGLSYNPRPPKPDPASNQRYGYTVERTIDVTVDKTDSTGAVVDAGVAAGVTSVNGIAFSLRDPRAAMRNAQAQAMDDAALQARALATVAGVRLVSIRAIAPGGAAVRPQPALMGARMAMAAPQVPTTIDPTDLTVHATVTVEYAIAPAR